jgi:hypothetical protein
MSLEEPAALVCATLERHGIRAVLSGGSVVSIYSDNEYQSYDLDFVSTGLARRADPAMEELGFRREGRHWDRRLVASRARGSQVPGVRPATPREARSDPSREDQPPGDIPLEPA